MSKMDLTERDICTKYIIPAIKKAGWNIQTQVREEVPLTAGRVIVRGHMRARSKGKRADFVLYHKPNTPLAIIEAKKNTLPIVAGMQQELGYSELLKVPFVFSSNGDGFIFHDKTGLFPKVEQELSLDQFPSHEELWTKYQQWKGYQPQELATITQDYYEDGSGKSPRYYQMHAINKTLEAIAKGQNRVLLINRVNSKELVGKTAIIPEIDEPLVFESMNMRAKPHKGLVVPEYLNLYMLTTLAKTQASFFAKEAVGQASINQGQVSSMCTPFPPLKEQRPIVARVDELMALCDQLKTRLIDAQATQLHLADTIVDEALS